MNFLHSIKFRFTLWYLLVLAVLLVLLGVGVYFNLSRTLNNGLNNSLRTRAKQLASIRHIVGMISNGRFEENIGEVITFYYRSDGKTLRVAPQDKYLPIDDETINKVINGEKLLTTIETSTGKKLRVFATPYVLKLPPHGFRDRPQPPEQIEPGFQHPRRPRPPRLRDLKNYQAAIFVARDTESVENAMVGLFYALLFAIPITLLIAGGGGAFLAGRVLKPVDQITKAARTIEESDLSRRINVHTKDELGGLAFTLNQMIDRLEKAFKRQKQFTGDASHELRAPLAVIGAESTLALQKDRDSDEYRSSLTTVANEVKHMSIIIDQLLNLARVDAGSETLSFGEVQLDELLQKLCKSREERCKKKEIDLQLNILNKATINGDQAMLKLLFSNLLENAIKYMQTSGKITVLVREEEKETYVHITDTGIGIPEKDLPHIFDRFFRVDKARSRAEGGSGLGLSICKQIAEIHNGQITVESTPSKGSTFTVRL